MHIADTKMDVRQHSTPDLDITDWRYLGKRDYRRRRPRQPDPLSHPPKNRNTSTLYRGQLSVLLFLLVGAVGVPKNTSAAFLSPPAAAPSVNILRSKGGSFFCEPNRSLCRSVACFRTNGKFGSVSAVGSEYTRHSNIVATSAKRNEDDDDTYDTKGENNDYGEARDEVEDEGDEYFEKFISEALRDGDKESPSTTKASSVMDETRQQMEDQQKQIDLLLKLVQGQQGNTSGRGGPQNSRRNDQNIISSPAPQQNTVNVAPLKAMVFIDGTWLYYSLHTRDKDRCPIQSKLGRGWQNYHKVNWQALPRLISTQMQQQNILKGGPDRPVEIARTMVFTSAKKDTDPNSIRMRMFRDMATSNYDVHMMETIGKGEKCVDIQLAVEMLHYATVPNAFDIAILLSGDKDFVPALVRTRQKGKQMCIVSMRRGCNRVLFESPHIRDYDVVWLEDFLDEFIVPIPDDEMSNRDRGGYASVFTLMRIIRDFVDHPQLDLVSSRDIGKYLKTVEISDSNMLEELKQSQGGLRAFLGERACNLFDVKYPEETSRNPNDHGFWVTARNGSDQILIEEFKRTQFFTKEEKVFLEDYKKEKYITAAAYSHTMEKTGKQIDDDSLSSDNERSDDMIDIESSLEKNSSPALNYSMLTVTKLRELCRDKGLPVSGKKALLVERLEEDRTLEGEIILQHAKKARDAKRQSKMQRASMGGARVNKKIPVRTSTSGDSGGVQVMSNIYAATLPQMNLNAVSPANTHSSRPDKEDKALASHLEGLVKEYLMASGGASGSRDIGRYLAANRGLRRGNRSALTELKEAFGSLLSFLRSCGGTFEVLEHSGEENGFPIKLR